MVRHHVELTGFRANLDPLIWIRDDVRPYRVNAAQLSDELDRHFVDGKEAPIEVIRSVVVVLFCLDRQLNDANIAKLLQLAHSVLHVRFVEAVRIRLALRIDESKTC